MGKTLTKSLSARSSELADPKNQLQVLADAANIVESFQNKLEQQGINKLVAGSPEILQVNVGYKCNQTCDHCHVDAGPDRKEVMDRETLVQCLEALDNSNIKTVDITGGAPEMNPDFQWFVEEVSKRDVEVMVRSNLTILVSNKNYRTYPEFFKKHKIHVVASLPCYTESNTDKQRGDGVFNASVEALLLLNSVGYGTDPDLKLDLVYNPLGLGLAPDQANLEVDYKRELKENFEIVFNNLFALNNLPISRFLEYLLVIGRYEEYMTKLVNAYNPMALEGLMCRNTVSVDWNGQLYDCDFNQILRLPVNETAPQNISDFNARLLQGREIAISQHCYGCTAGAGSSCQGAILND